MRKRKPTGQRIRAARKKAGLTMVAAAKRIGISQPYLSDIEAGKKDPWKSPDDLRARIAEAVGVPVASLLEK